MNQPLLIFSLISLVSLLIIYPLTPKVLMHWKKPAYTLGILTLHVGLYGLLWQWIPQAPLMAALLIEAGLFILFDPLKLLPPTIKKIKQLIGFLLFVGGGTLILSLITLFPWWLWIIPLALYAAATFVPTPPQHHKLLLAASMIISLIYIGIIGYGFYNRSFKNTGAKSEGSLSQPLAEPTPTESIPPSLNSMTNTLDPNLPSQKTVIATETPPQSVATGGPLTSAIQEIDQKMQKLELENKRLQEEIAKLKTENEVLKKDFDQKAELIKKQNENIENLKRMVENF